MCKGGVLAVVLLCLAATQLQAHSAALNSALARDQDHAAGSILQPTHLHGHQRRLQQEEGDDDLMDGDLQVGGGADWDDEDIDGFDALTVEEALAREHEAEVIQEEERAAQAIQDAKDVQAKNAEAGAKQSAGGAKPATTTDSKGKKAATENKVVTFVPGANVTNNDDVDADGQCKDEVKRYCEDVEQGEGNLADCLSNLMAIAENPELVEADQTVPNISETCREEVYQWKITRNSNINRNIPLARACKVDAEKFCNNTWFFGYHSGLVIGCLREFKPKLGKGCQRELTKVQRDAAEDIRADPDLWEACKEDAGNYCKDVKFGGGRVQACLRDNKMKLSWECDDELYRQEKENADDIRLSTRLYAKCMSDKRKFCRDVEPGHARTKECLEAHREQLSEGCKEEIDTIIERRVRDFRLDPKLKEACEEEFANVCAVFEDTDDVDTFDTSVINCLQDYVNEIKSQDCKRQVDKYLVLASQDIRFDVSLAEHCYEDRQKFCANVPPGSARVIRCLQHKRNQLSQSCRVTLFDEEVRFSENLDFQYPMKEACATELATFCKDVPRGNARAIRCLQDHKKEKGFGNACKKEIKAYEAEINKDYRLNFRLAKACTKEISSLCPKLCDHADGNMCGGKVLRCLSDKVEEIKTEDCRAEVFYYQKMEVENFENDIILAEACRADVDKLCANVEPGEGRVHQCLRDNRAKLSDACRHEELLLEQTEMGHIELAAGLLRSCKAERQLYCRDVRPGSARVFRCLAENMNDADFGSVCRDQVTYKLQRRQANWKLDPPLRKACRADVAQLCGSEDSQNSEQGLVYKCLIRNVASISPGCQRELGRAVHMALYVWQPGSILTLDCDDDIQQYCLAVRPSMAQRPGAVGSCLASILERQDQAAASPSGRRRVLLAEADDGAGTDVDAEDDNADTIAVVARASRPGAVLANARLSEKCYDLADIAEPPNMKQAFDASLSYAALKSQLDRFDSAVGNVGLVTRTPRGKAESISLTGWVAMLGMAAFVTLIAYGAWAGYRRWRGLSDRDGYTLVVKPRKG